MSHEFHRPMICVDNFWSKAKSVRTKAQAGPRITMPNNTQQTTKNMRASSPLREIRGLKSLRRNRSGTTYSYSRILPDYPRNPQANNTPLREEPLVTLFKERTLDYDTWEKVLDPTTPLPDNLERGTTLWFRQMRKESSNIPQEPIKITVDKYRESWRKMKEATSSHPGLHFGHFISMDNESELANEVHTVLANVPL